MKLDFVPLDKLSVSKANMRYAKKAPDVADLLPTVRKRGVLQPVIVRPVANTGEGKDARAGCFEIVAGLRRFTAAGIVADERRASGEAAEPLPCAILDEGDDAAAIEASLIENIARRDADEVTQWETFTRLVREGQSPAEIAATFGLPDLAVKRVLALGNLLPAIRRLYAAGEIDAASVRHLTMASKRQQQEWLALAQDREACCPTGERLKAWLFGGQSIPVAHALFDVAASGLATTADLFGDDAYFADADAFWAAQNAAVEAKRAAFVEAGWSDAMIVPPGEYFSSWEYEKTAKRKGGRVYLDVRASGEVTIHEGYLGRRDAARLMRGETPAARPARPELTGPLQNYVDLHRHAAVRAALLGHPQIALRLMVAHAIHGSALFRLTPEPQITRNEAVRTSLDESRAEAVFDERRRAVLAMLGFDADAPTVTGGNGHDYGLVGLFARLLELPDPAVLEVLTIVMGETLASGSAAVEAVGLQLGVAIADWWEADDAFFALVRDREVMRCLVAEVAGETVAAANAGEKTKAMQKIVRDHLDGADGRTRVAGWVPAWMRFPPAAYTGRGGVGTVAAHDRAAAALAMADDETGDTRDPAAAGQGSADHDCRMSDPPAGDARLAA